MPSKRYITAYCLYIDRRSFSVGIHQSSRCREGIRKYLPSIMVISVDMKNLLALNTHYTFGYQLRASDNSKSVLLTQTKRILSDLQNIRLEVRSYGGSFTCAENYDVVFRCNFVHFVSSSHNCS